MKRPVSFLFVATHRLLMAPLVRFVYGHGHGHGARGLSDVNYPERVSEGGRVRVHVPR
jgi:hypothetical protein